MMLPEAGLLQVENKATAILVSSRETSMNRPLHQHRSTDHLLEAYLAAGNFFLTILYVIMTHQIKPL